MFKKSLVTAALVCAVPAVASASWFLATQALNTGGTINTRNNTAQKVTDGAVYKTYTTSAGLPLTVSADDGYTIRSVTVNGATVNNPNSPYTTTITGSKDDKSVTAVFVAGTLQVTASIPGGSVTPSRVNNILYGYTLNEPMVFTFSPKVGAAITKISGAPFTDDLVGAKEASGTTPGWSVPGGVNQKATVTFPAGYTFKSTVNLSASVDDTLTASLSPILAQTVVAGSPVTLKAVTNNIASPTFKWGYASGPLNTFDKKTVDGKVITKVLPGPAVAGFGTEATDSFGNVVYQADTTLNSTTFQAPATPGQYKFQVTVGNFTKLAVVNVVANAAAMVNQCNNCHTAAGIADATVVTKWQASKHSSDTASALCTTCHVGSGSGGHPGVVTPVETCSSCHGDKGFPDTKHWVNSKEYGPEFTGGAVAGEINPNESWTTYEDGAATTCAYRCHFKPGLGPVKVGAKSTGGTTYSDTLNGVTHTRYGGDGCAACHDPHLPNVTFQDTCLTCHSGSKHGKVPNEFFGSKHWNNHFEYGPEFANQLNATVSGGNVKFSGTGPGYLDANDGYTTTEDGAATTCAYRCHFRPGMYPAGVTPPAAYYDVNKRKATTYTSYNDTLNGVTYKRPGGDACIACHDSHDLKAGYQTCLICHTGSKHGKVPNEFFASKHWQSSSEYGPEFRNQLNATVAGGNVKLSGTTDGVLEPNDSYQTYENDAVVTCAYRCHFRPGMGPKQNVDNYLTNGKSITYVSYSSPYGAGHFYRPGGDACMACHDAHGLEATARSTCYTCHAGGNHGWSVKAFEKSSHFTSQYAIADGMGGPTGKACTACHDAHSTEATFFTYSGATAYNTPVKGAVGCQSCHTPGQSYSIYDANRVGKAPHFQLAAPDSNGYYPTASYITDNPAYSNSCADCHSHNNTINKGWAAGGHGDVNATPWKTSFDDDWNRGTVVTDYKVSAQKTDCQRCHTAKGFTQFWDSSFTDITPLGGKSSAPLVCSGCHSNVEKGTVRALPAGFSAGVQTFVGYSTVAYSTKKSVTAMTFPDMKNSNVCLPCHAGRGTGALIKEVFKTPTPDDGVTTNNIYNIGTKIYSHFAAAAGVFNGSSAYEFTTGTIANPHSQIGLANKGTQGPCVACHMTTKATADVPNMSHSVKTIDFAANTFLTDACKNCHATMTVADVANTKAEFNAALQVLRNLLLQRGIEALQAEIASRPGERKAQDMRGNAASKALIAALNLNDVTVAERNTGAAFNWWLFGTSSTGVAQGDVAAYVHNPNYVRQVIKDSIDWLDDYQLNQSAAATVDSMVGKAQPIYNDGTDGVAIDSTLANLAKAFLK